MAKYGMVAESRVSLKELLEARQFEFKKGYIYMPTGEISSPPALDDEYVMMLTDNKGADYKFTFERTDEGNKFVLATNRSDIHFDTLEQALAFFNKNKLEYIGFDDPR
jgi:hypothetical protein